jgi:hypothetical protein
MPITRCFAALALILGAWPLLAAGLSDKVGSCGRKAAPRCSGPFHTCRPAPRLMQRRCCPADRRESSILTISHSARCDFKHRPPAGWHPAGARQPDAMRACPTRGQIRAAHAGRQPPFCKLPAVAAGRINDCRTPSKSGAAGVERKPRPRTATPPPPKKNTGPVCQQSCRSSTAERMCSCDSIRSTVSQQPPRRALPSCCARARKHLAHA